MIINYNFIIGESGIYEGRGWDIEIDKPLGENELFLGIFSSSYTLDEEVKNLIEALVEDGKAIGKLTSTLIISCNVLIRNCDTEFPTALTTVCTAFTDSA